jgi:hypothetical protein
MTTDHDIGHGPDATVVVAVAVASSSASASASACATTSSSRSSIIHAKVAALFPPRPDAILTYLPSNDFLPGTQTLLYSLQKTTTTTTKEQQERKQQQSMRIYYPPEIVVMVPKYNNNNSSNNNNRNLSAGSSSSSSLGPVDLLLCQRWVDTGLCTRILEVEYWPAPTNTTMKNDTNTTNNNMVASTGNDGNNNNNNNNDKNTNDVQRQQPTIQQNQYQRHLDSDPIGDWTKLQIFNLQQYDTILYINSDCLVMKDVTHLLELNKVYVESDTALIAAAPEVYPSDQFNSGVMVIRPSHQAYTCIQDFAAATSSTTVVAGGGGGRMDPSVTAFLNAYFSTWYKDYPPFARLSSGYNAPQIWYDWTATTTTTTQYNNDDDATTTSTSSTTPKKYEEMRSMFWDVQVAPNLYIIHYSNPIKPWQYVMDTKKGHKISKDSVPSLSSSSSSNSSLVMLFRTWYKNSQNYISRIERERAKEQQLENQELDQKRLVDTGKKRMKPHQQQQQSSSSSSSTQRKDQHPRDIHRLIQRRYKTLRSKGLSTTDAMKQARMEVQQESDRDDDDDIDVGSQVAAMFGMRLQGLAS